MVREVFLSAAFFGMGAIWFSASSYDESGSEGATTRLGVTGSETFDQTTAWYADDHVLHRAGDGHFYAEAEINGAPTRLLVDTGASIIALTGEDALRAGLEWHEDEVQLVGQGASGAVHGVRRTIALVDVGGMEESDVSAIIVPEGLSVSLLGQSYLGRIEQMQVTGDTIVLARH